MEKEFLLFLIISILIFLHPVQRIYADQSEGFTKKGIYWYDSWDINRNSAGGNDGYFPILVYESLGLNRERAYEFGKWFLTEYSNRVTRAERIMRFIQSMVKYKYDEENPFVLAVTNNEKQEEWAWNPDEMAHMIDVAYDNREVAHGDCEDFTFILTVMYLAAGYEVTIVDAIVHAALLIFLPDYPNANVYWDIGDGRGAGWIWVEATGDRNPLGWTPDDYKNVEFNVRKLETGLYFLEIQDNDSDCFITIATIGSDLFGELQFVRGFRDNLIRSTFVGSQFTEIFNSWYYSFSPEVADFIAKDQVAKEIVKDFLYPLLGIVRISFYTYQLLAFNLELSVAMAIMTASFLIGVFYFSLPVMLLISLMNKHMYKFGNVKKRTYVILSIPSIASLGMIGLSECTHVSTLMITSTAMLVLTTISASALIIGLRLSKKFFPIKS